MSGYGKPDDEADRAAIRVEEQIALTRAALPKGPSRTHCIECGNPIPEARRLALPGVHRCVGCQEELGDTRLTAKQPWAT